MQLAKLWGTLSIINSITNAFYYRQQFSQKAFITKTTSFEKCDKFQPTNVSSNHNTYKIECTLATIDLKPVIKNLARFYVYEFSRYTGEDFPKDGLLEAFETSFHFDNYWNSTDHYPFIFHVDNQLAGFALVNKQGSTIDVDWYLAEFYIVAKFQNKGIGLHIAMHLLTQFSGTWEVSQIPNNHPAVAFWRKILQQLTDGQYTETLQEFQTPYLHQMLVHKFQCQENFIDNIFAPNQSG